MDERRYNMKKLIVLAAAVLFIVGCGGSKSYYPLAVGNLWNYTTTTSITHTDTTLFNDTTYTSTHSEEITAEVTLTNGDPAFEFVVTSGSSKDTSYVAELNDFVLGYDSLSDTNPDTMIAYPLEEGKSWTVTSDSGYTLKAYAIEKIDSSIVVPSGTYDDVWKLYWVTTVGSTVDTAVVFVAPEIGMIKQTYQNVNVFGSDTMTVDVKTELQTVTIK